MKTTLFLLVPLLSLTLAQTTTTPPCVASCEKTSAASSTCNGNETGAALDQCTCDSLIGTSLITCIQACPSSEISVFAAGVPALCRGTLFPGVTVSSSSDGAAPTTSSGGSGSGATTTSSGSPSSTASPSSSSTAKSGGGTGAAVQGKVLDISLVAAFMGGVFTLLML
ncbi:uncharacterized protein K444DRAFT_622693 [Hyaloscypha bicolor E]|uniref:Extracellular membrane protein CFEM domain-containing protein n=1 Tax=Hyaloscypha bicolor E TaxID=1095630 RepID=A0A2J6SFU0_9HELO|nr:uncharacterized protein K444DRAFT_622693 [Hyaloscypha bicolor E]PMD49620.1 hypothetical protein K444DRAFT_622693 [Hyaloscypha bicolor E]